MPITHHPRGSFSCILTVISDQQRVFHDVYSFLSLGSSDPFYLRFGIGISMILLFNKIAKNMDDTERIVAVRNMRLYDSPDGNSAKPLIFKMD
jgi:hypothetical protein